MYTRILIPVDSSDEAEHAARHGLALARVFDATVDVLHVVGQNALQLTNAADEQARLREQGQAVLDEIEALASEGDQTVTTTLAEGNPAVQISKHAASRDVDLVVIGRQGTSGLGKRLLGGVTEQVLHESEIPVFVVPEPGQSAGETTEVEASYDRVLIPTDGSDNAEAATPQGAAMVRTLDATIHVLNVVDLQAAGGVFDAGGLRTEFIERLEDRGQEAVDRVADELASRVSDVDIKTAVKRTTSHDAAARGIREYVETTSIDLVVMGSHGRSNLKRQLLGSVASSVLRTVDVPVLVVKRTP